jgi:hydroxyethylthiazole kinase-like uncharacterized protein yjeF
MQTTCWQFYSAAQVRELDRRAIEDHGIPGAELMRRAASAAWSASCRRWGLPRRIAVFCGAGNNGGDGYEIARLAQAAGVEVRLFELPGERRGDAAVMREVWRGVGEIQTLSEADCLLPTRVDLVVDALLGTGLSRPPNPVAEVAITAINAARAAGARVLAVDLPSGLKADTGHAPGAVVQADLTVTFIGDKPGLHTGRGPALCGEVQFESLAVPAAVYEGMPSVAERLDPVWLRQCLPPRPRDAHKGHHGHVLIIGGAPGMSGAVLLAGRAALRSGAGLVSVATHPAHAAALAAAQPELMVHAVEDAIGLGRLLERADVLAVGPGLGTGEWSQGLWQAALDSRKPLVLDADGLNLLLRAPQALADAVVTPHPGEAARLLDTDTAGIARDRFAAAAALHTQLGAVVVLKGAGTLVHGARVGLCTAGNPGMATGGSGDVLTGVVAALRAQGLDAETAARAGVVAHARAGDLAAVQGTRGMLPSDLIQALRQVVNP